MTAQVLRHGAFSLHVCVPSSWKDEQVVSFANRSVICGTENGWIIRREGNASLNGDPERQQCAQRGDHVHIMLDA